MTTSDLERWARAEAERRYEPRLIQLFDGAFDEAATSREAFEFGILHLAEVLQSETAVEAALKALYLDHATDQIAPTAPEIAAARDRMARAALAAALAAVTDQETGDSQ